MNDDRDALVAELVRLVERQPAAGPGLVWQAVSTGSSYSFRRHSTVPGAQVRRIRLDGAALAKVMSALDPALRTAGDDRTLVMEIAFDDAARPKFSYSFEVSSVSPSALVLGPAYRYPQHPAPGMPRPDLAVPTEAPTDPAVLARVRALVEEFTALYTQVTGHAPAFEPAATEQEIVEAERRLGLRLPEDVRALYRVVGADSAESGLLGNYALQPLDRVVSDYLDGEPGCWNWHDGLFDTTRVVLAAADPQVVRRVSRSDWRVLIGSDYAGNGCAVDLDPGPAGRTGQLLEYGRDFSGQVGVAAESVTALLTAVLDAVRTALRDNALSYQDGGDHIGVHLPRWSRPSPTVSWRVEEQDLAALVAGLTESAATQRLFLNDAESLDLRALAALPNVRDLSVNRAGAVRLWLPPELEALSLEARSAELSALAGHPVLWDLTLRGLRVRVAEVAALPALRRLDLSGAEVEDIQRLAELDLKVLVLNAEQWQALRAAGRRPSGLAGAELAGTTTPADAVDWARWLNTGAGRA